MNVEQLASKAMWPVRGLNLLLCALFSLFGGAIANSAWYIAGLVWVVCFFVGFVLLEVIHGSLVNAYRAGYHRCWEENDVGTSSPDVSTAVRAALAAEREACARLALTQSSHPDTHTGERQ